MVSSSASDPFCCLLCADMRFGRQSVLNDQCWAFGPGLETPSALSLVTSFGLRAIRMHIFPEFSIEDHLIRDPASFRARPRLSFSSSCFAAAAFSPFPLLDVEFRVWVPDPQVLVGQITFVNTSDFNRTIGVDWRVHLQPVQGGSPMKQSQVGLNSILQGECGNIFPSFYMTGGAYPSISDYPGLGNRILLMPGSQRQVTWAMASLDSSEASAQLARQYSSKALDVEQIKIEMADNRSMVRCQTQSESLTNVLHHAQNRAYQLVMAPVKQHSYPTYVSNRSPDTGNYHSEDILEIHPEWAGQTLTEIYLLAQTLLPGRADIVKGLLHNFIKIQTPEGFIDHRASVNHNFTGHASLPVLASLVADLHPYLQDTRWLSGIYPGVLSFLKTWLQFADNGDMVISGLTNPVQLDFPAVDAASSAVFCESWIRLTSSLNPFLLSLLYRETTDLLQIARWINQEEDRGWLENARDRLQEQLTSLWNAEKGRYACYDLSSGEEHAGKTLTVFSATGLPKIKNNLPCPARLFIRVAATERLPADFTCRLSGFSSGEYTELVVGGLRFQRVGECYLFVTPRAFSFVESFQVTNLPAGAHGELGVADLVQPDVLGLLPLYAGVLATDQADTLLSTINIKDYLTGEGISFSPHRADAPALRLPAYLTVMIIEGLTRYGKYALAEECFNRCYSQFKALRAPTSGALTHCVINSIEEIVPLRVFLRLNGLERITNREVVISHFDGKQEPINVQYNQLKLVLRHNLTEIHLQADDVIYLNQPGLNRVILE